MRKLARPTPKVVEDATICFHMGMRMYVCEFGSSFGREKKMHGRFEGRGQLEVRN